MNPIAAADFGTFKIGFPEKKGAGLMGASTSHVL